MKKCSEATQTLCTGCSKADPQTNTQTDRDDYNTLCSLAHSVKHTQDKPRMTGPTEIHFPAYPKEISHQCTTSRQYGSSALPEGPLPSLSLTTKGSWLHVGRKGRQASRQPSDTSTRLKWL